MVLIDIDAFDINEFYTDALQYVPEGETYTVEGEENALDSLVVDGTLVIEDDAELNVGWEAANIGFDSTGDLDTLQAGEAVAQYVVIQLAEQIDVGGSFTAEEQHALRNSLETLLGQLQENGHVGEYSRPRFVRTEDETLNIAISFDGSVLAIPTDLVSQ